MTEDQKILYSLAAAMEKTRIELDGMRVVLKGVVTALAAEPAMLAKLATSIDAAVLADEAFALNSPMPDSMLDARARWVKALLPGDLATLIRP